MVYWFDSHPIYYWIIAWISFGLLGCAALLPVAVGLFSEKIEQRMLHFLPRWLFMALAALCLFAFRWPTWYVPKEFNPDESEFLAEALTLQHRPVFWGAVDGESHGPLDVFPLCLLRGVGLKYDFFGERLFGAILMLALIFGCYRALAAYARESVARAAVLPIMCMLVFCSFWDFVSYSSEDVPIASLAIGFWLLVSDLARPLARRRWSARWIAGGLLLGAVPMAKLQGGPASAALLVTCAVCDLCHGGIELRIRVHRTLVLAASSLATTVFIVLLTWAFGALRHAWLSYVIQNLNYTQAANSPLYMIQHFWEFVQQAVELSPYLVGVAIVAALSLMIALMAPASNVRLAVLALVFLAASLGVAIAPGRFYPHYLLFLIAPAGVLAGALWVAGWQSAERAPQAPWVRAALLLLLLGALVCPQIVARATHPHPYLGQLRSIESLANDPVTIEIRRYGHPGESLGMWGWMCRYYAYTGMWQATRKAHTYKQITPSPQIDYYRYRYMQDLQRNRPPVFVDAVGPGNFLYNDRAVAHESFPALRDYIATHYRQMADINGCRIYVRLDRLAQP